ncbi:unnamed protein product [Prunus armeniaca]
MNEEMRALQKNGTWELVSLPHGKKTVGCRWIYTVKLKANESIEKYKTRLVAKGYTQRYRIDQETFALVAKIKTIRVLLSLAANLDWPLHQFDVKKCILTWRLGRRSIYGLATRICKPAATPIEMNHKLCIDMDQEPTNEEQYQRLVGRDLKVVGYTDDDWAGSVTDIRSTSGYFTFVGSNLVTWRSKK